MNFDLTLSIKKNTIELFRSLFTTLTIYIIIVLLYYTIAVICLLDYLSNCQLDCYYFAF